MSSYSWLRNRPSIRSSRGRALHRTTAPRCRPALELLEGRLLPAVFVVTSTADSGANTFRQAILNANAHPGADMITFNIAGPGVHVIQPASPQTPVIGSALIDGTTQPGYAGTPLIQLDGSLAGTGANGLTINANTCIIRGLDISRFNNDGIFVQGNNNVFESNFIGTDPTGSQGQGNGGYGVEISGASKSNLSAPTATARTTQPSATCFPATVNQGCASLGPAPTRTWSPATSSAPMSPEPSPLATGATG
jgi:hypothetical protein